MSWISPADSALYLAAGLALGALYFALLFRTVRLHASQASAAQVIPLYVIRLAAALAAFWVIAQQGALSLLLALLGFLIARAASQRWIGAA